MEEWNKLAVALIKEAQNAGVDLTALSVGEESDLKLLSKLTALNGEKTVASIHIAALNILRKEDENRRSKRTLRCLRCGSEKYRVSYGTCFERDANGREIWELDLSCQNCGIITAIATTNGYVPELETIDPIY